jgi:hypothetical protein
MGSWRYRRLLRQAWHPQDEELLLYVEGEADARSARRLSDHLSGCWTCRARRTEIERAIGAYMSYDRDAARAAAAGGADGGDATEQATRRFALALARAKERPQHTSERPQRASEPESAKGWSERWKRLRAERERAKPLGERRVAWTLARAAAVAVAIVLVMRWWLAPTAVSARELIARVDRAHQQEVAAVADPVVYQRLHASRTSSNSRAATDDTVTWEVWSSQRQRRIVERVSASSPLLHDLQAVLRENGMEPGQPLSAASLTAWRRLATAGGHVAEDVRETTLSDGTAAVTLTSSAPGPVKEGRIARSEVIVRTRDWHPVAHILTIAGASAGAAGQRERYTITELSYRVVPLETVDATVFNPPAIAPVVDADNALTDAPAAAASAPAIHPARSALLALYEEHTTGACLRDRTAAEASAGANAGSGGNGSGGTGNDGVAEAAMRHLWAIRQLAEWYRSAEADGLTRGLDIRSRAMLVAMIREHVEAARQELPPNAAAAIEPDANDHREPWTTTAMKAYAAVEYASRTGAADAADAPIASGTADAAGASVNGGDVGARREAVARARALLRSLDAAVQRLAPGAAPAAADGPPARGVTRPHDHP